MAGDGHLFFVRARWFWEQLRAKTYPNAAKLAEKFNISTETARRVIDRLRDDHYAPIEYDEQRHGYFLQKQDWMLPFLPTSVDEILALALARYHLRQASEGLLGNFLETYWERILPALGEKIPPALLDDALYSVADTRSAPVVDTILRTILEALVGGVRAKITYRSPWRDEPTEREISPWHLRFEDGRLYLWAYCHLRKEPRLFHVVGITSARPTRSAATPRPVDFASIYLAGGVGKFFSQKPFEVRVRIFPPRARYVAAERWHAEQHDHWQGDVLERAFPADHIQEIAGHLLYLGESVEVLSPKSLREEIARQAREILLKHK